MLRVPWLTSAQPFRSTISSCKSNISLNQILLLTKSFIQASLTTKVCRYVCHSYITLSKYFSLCSSTMARARPCRRTCLGVEDAERDEAPDLRGDGQDECNQVLQNRKGITYSGNAFVKTVLYFTFHGLSKGPITRGQMPMYFLQSTRTLCTLFKLTKMSREPFNLY